MRQPEVREVLGADIAEAFRQGSGGAALDVVLLGRPRGSRLDTITSEVLLWKGEDDTLVPPAGGGTLRRRFRTFARRFPGEGRLLVVDHMSEIVPAFTPPSGGSASVRESPCSGGDLPGKKHAKLSAF